MFREKLSIKERQNRLRWWLNESPAIVGRIEAYLVIKGFSGSLWREGQLDCSFFRNRGGLIDEICIGAKSEGRFSTTFAIRSAVVTQLELQLDLVTAALETRKIQRAAIANGPRFLVFADLRGLAPAAAVGISHQESYVNSADEQIDVEFGKWRHLIDSLWPFFFDEFQTSLVVADFCVGDVPTKLMPVLAHDQTAVVAGNGHIKRYMFAALLYGLAGDVKKARIAVDNFVQHAEWMYASESGRETELSDARRYKQSICTWLSGLAP